MKEANESPKTRGLLPKMEKKLPLLLLLGGALLLLGLLWPQKEEASEKEEASFDAAAYQAARQEEARAIAATVSGDPSAAVTLYFEGGCEYVYAADKASDGRTDYLYSGGKGLLLTVKMPRVSGVAVIVTGGSNAARREELSRVFSALYGLGYDRIEITERRQK